MERSSSRAVTALLVAIISIPLSSQAVFRSQDDDGQQFEAIGDIREDVYEYQAGDRQTLRRAYSLAIEAYREKLRLGITDAVKPDINDPSTFKEFIVETEGKQVARVRARAPSTQDTEHAVAPDEDTLGTDELSSRQRMLLRTYTRADSCPASMEKVLPGFHALCKSIVGDDASDELPTGIETDLKSLRHRGLPPTSLKLRLKMIEQANDRSTRRTGVPVPMRPTPYQGE